MSGTHIKTLRLATLAVLFLLTLPLVTTGTLAAAEFNFVQSTPVGSWALREDLSTDHKGKQTVTEMKFSIVDKEKVEGVTHYWIEMETQSYKVKKDTRKKQGDRGIFKMLVNADLFTSSPANALANLSKNAKTIIVQNGNSDPMRIEQGGMLGDSMLQALGVQVEFDYKQGGTKTVEVPAGKISCTSFEGEGSTETKVMIKTFRVESKTSGCFSNKIPFGLVYAESNSTINGKPMTGKTQLMKYGSSGATTAITKTPVDAPKMPKLF